MPDTHPFNRRKAHFSDDFRAYLRVRELARERGLTQLALQINVAVTPGLIARYWHNRTTSVDMTVIARLAQVLDVEIGALFTLTPPADEKGVTDDETTAAERYK